MKKILLIALSFAPMTLFASDVETDIIQRTLNFVIFAAILYYLLAQRIKGFLNDRSLLVQKELNQVQDILSSSAKKIDVANSKLEEAKKLSHEIVEIAKNETSKISENMLKVVEEDILKMKKHFDEKIAIEVKKTKKEIVYEVLNDLLDSSNIDLKQEDLANIILKKVA